MLLVGIKVAITLLQCNSSTAEDLWSLDCNSHPFDFNGDDTTVEEDILAGDGVGGGDASDEDTDEEDGLKRDYIDDGMPGDMLDNSPRVNHKKTSGLAKVRQLTWI